MDVLRASDFGPDDHGSDFDDVIQAPPPVIGQDERRMQVRAYNYWAGLLGKRRFPAPDRLVAGDLPEFFPNCVLLNFSDGSDDPQVRAIGPALAAEFGDQPPIGRLSQVPGRSVLSQINDHYQQIIANAAPAGFEAEFVNARGTTILCRGILLPFSSDGVTIDYILGVINWKELADQHTTDELRLEVGRALDDLPIAQRRLPIRRASLSHADDQVWADGPALAREGTWEATARALPAYPLCDLARDGAEFALVMVRRRPGGDPAVLGEIAEDGPLLARAARQIIG